MSDKHGQPNFEVRYSVFRLLLLAAPLLAVIIPLSYMLVASGEELGWPVLLIIVTGLLFFGGALIWLVSRLFDRRVQIQIDAEGVLIREWSGDVIPHKSIKRVRNGGSYLGLWLRKPTQYPPATFIGRVRRKLQSRQALEEWGDIYAISLLYDRNNEEIIDAMEGLRPKSSFEQKAATFIAEQTTEGVSPE